jgi:integrase
MARQLSENTVKHLAVPATGNRVHYFAGHTVQGQTAPRGFGVRVTAGGSKAFVLNYRVAGRERRFTIGEWKDAGGGWSVVDAAKHARSLRKKIDRGEDPLQERELANAPAVTGKTVSDVIDAHVASHVIKLRSAKTVERTFERLVKPRLGALGIYELRRSHIMDALDKIADENGLVMADRTLSCLRKALNWYAVRDDEFNSPIVRGMARTKPRESAGTRILGDDEIRDVWTALDGVSAPFPALVRVLLLTPQRRSEVGGMRWDEIEERKDGDLWTLPSARNKTKVDHVAPITKAVRAIIGDKPTKGGPFVFSTTNGKQSFSGFSKGKKALDERIAELRDQTERKPMPHWTLHDLRRTARSLMSRAGVTSDVAERCLGHVIGGVRGTYDRHSYETEKRDALDRLAALVERILHPAPANVVQLREAVQ